MNRDAIVSPATNTTNAADTNATPTDTNAALNINAVLPNEVKGDKELNGKAAVGDVELNFSSVSKTDTFEGEQAPDKKTFVIVFFDAVEGSQVLTVKNGLTGNHRLITNTGNATPAGLKVASTLYQGDRGYLKYIADDAATTFNLEIGVEGSAQRIPLSI
jgi:hypothetical protein